MGVVSLVLRLDDVHARTPVWLLRGLDSDVWAGRPVVLGVIPYPAPGCLGAVASAREVPGGCDTTAMGGVVSYVDERRGCGLGEVGVHGLTHASQGRGSSRVTAELVAASAACEQRLMGTLRRFEKRFGSRTLIPPHNYIASGLRQRVLAAGFHVCRAITDEEVRQLGIDSAGPAARAEAKRRRAFGVVGASVDLYQTAGVSYERLRRDHVGPEQLAESVMGIAAVTGVGVLTFHWWDFLTDGGQVRAEVVEFTRRLLACCERLAPVRYETISRWASMLVRSV